MDTALVIMAAGMGSRFGGGIKQLAEVGPNKEIIMDYSIYDALQAGFNKIVFIIRKDLKEAFRAAIGERIEKIGVPVAYAYQEKEDLPAGVDAEKLLATRKKPWGTGQAVLSCKGIIDCPFVVINADDFYGRDAFQKVHDFLVSGQGGYCMAGFYLENTLSDNGSVTRGICKTDEQGFMVDVKETRNIVKAAGGNAEADGVQLSGKSLASMNMWGLQPQFLDYLEQGFVKFLQDPATDDSAEYLLPEMVGAQVRAGEATVRVLPTDGQWFGVTYAADKPVVVESIRALVDAGVYPEKLYG
jgi:NDP-sugar pyrophosphorylase family protein